MRSEEEEIDKTSVSKGRIGEASRVREDGDDERPLKKARFAWQVKGKHHLRREEREPNAPQESDSDAEEAVAACPSTAAPMPLRTQQSSGVGHSASPCTVWENLEMMWQRELSHESFPTLLSRRPNRREDFLLETWQARQLAKCAVDNTINRVLDTWTTEARVHSDASDAGSAADASDAPAHSIEVENEGILMAISAHGLTTPHQHQMQLHTQDPVEQACCAHQDLEIMQLCSPCYHPDEDPFIPYLGKKTSSRADPSPASDRTDSESPHRGSESPQRSNESPQRGYESPHTQAEFPTTDQMDADEHFNFMDAAVAFAIQHKGLTSLASGNG